MTPFLQSPLRRLESESNPPAPRSYVVVRDDVLAKKCKILAVVCKFCRGPEIFPVQCEKNPHSPRATRGEEDSIARPQDNVAAHASMAKNGNVGLFRTAKPTPNVPKPTLTCWGKMRRGPSPTWPMWVFFARDGSRQRDFGCGKGRRHVECARRKPPDRLAAKGAAERRSGGKERARKGAEKSGELKRQARV